jgi:uncharacterized protein YdeI (YjbR/CyaY-like superfamily)
MNAPAFSSNFSEVCHMKNSPGQEPEIIHFKTQKELERWLDKNQNKSKGIWLHLFKKNSGVKSIGWQDAVEAGLCYGWIDGQAKPFDEQSWLQRFTPRRAKSIWSKKNTGHAERLIKAGRMKPRGLAEVEKAKADGRWDKAYDSPTSMKAPEDLLKALEKNKKAKAFFETLNKTNQSAINWRLQTAKKPETREKRMKKILEMLKKGEKFH